MKKQFLATIIVAASAIFGVTPQVSASTAIAYYSFNVNDNNQTTYSTASFSNSDGTVVLNGWQTCTNAPAANYYSIVEKGIIVDSYVSDQGEIEVTGNIPSSGNWYSITFTGVPNTSGLWVRVNNNTYGNNQGAGNAY